LPAEQVGIPYYNDYIILSNPNPIFPEHYTICKINHIPQNLENNLDGMLNLTKDLSAYFTLIYNGPECGASAPDHMHFQCFTKGELPVEHELNFFRNKFHEEIFSSNNISVFTVNKYLRNMIIVDALSIDAAKSTTAFILNQLGKITPAAKSYCTNIISIYRNKTWTIFIIPRRKHRPSYFYKEDDGQILISPAAVDLGGVCITPRKEDFDKIKFENIKEIFKEVCLPDEYFEYFKKTIREALKRTQL
jgi:hypothetical protein